MYEEAICEYYLTLHIQNATDYKVDYGLESRAFRALQEVVSCFDFLLISKKTSCFRQ